MHLRPQTFQGPPTLLWALHLSRLEQPTNLKNNSKLISLIFFTNPNSNINKLGKLRMVTLMPHRILFHICMQTDKLKFIVFPAYAHMHKKKIKRSDATQQLLYCPVEMDKLGVFAYVWSASSTFCSPFTNIWDYDWQSFQDKSHTRHFICVPSLPIL